MRQLLTKNSFVVAAFFFILVVLTGNKLVYAEDPTPTPTPASQDKLAQLQSQIKELQGKIADSQKQQKTLSSQIGIMDSQIKLTELRVNAIKQEIATLTGDIQKANNQITRLEESLHNLTKVLLGRIIATYQAGSVEPLQVLLSSNTVNDFFAKASYLRIAQAHDKKLIYETEQAKTDYQNEKNIFETKKKKVESLKVQLEAYNNQLAQEKVGKQQLLEVTKNDEQRYQKLLQEAQTQISAFKSFASSQGGATILPPQPSPDGWYYNQRDERWGRNTIGSSSEQVWDVGCLITSTAMVMKKHGQGVTPADVASNSGYFFSTTAYMLLPWAGGKLSASWGYDQGSIDSKLSGGEPIIVGLRAGAYGMHFVVLKSGSGGSYTMNDPWNGPDLKFSDYYSTGQIFQYGFYNG